MIAAGACQWSGAAMTTASSSGISSIRRMSGVPLGFLPDTFCTSAIVLSTTVLSTSHIQATSTSGFLANMRARARPRLLVPMTPTMTLLLGEPWKLNTLGAMNRPAPASADCLMNVRRLFFIVSVFLRSETYNIYGYLEITLSLSHPVHRRSRLKRCDVVGRYLKKPATCRLCSPRLVKCNDAIGRLQ